MKDKLSFSVEDIELVNDNPNSNFATLSLDFFASGENLNDMYVSEETLMRTADSIKTCPLVWKYDEKLDDAESHSKSEIPCGFVPETSTVQSKKMPDGRTMLSVVAYVWKRYTGELLNFFKRDGGKKPISVEMSVFESRPMKNGLMEILDFKYEGITVLGSFVTPAIPLANATVLSFSKLKEEYDEVFTKEFVNAVDMFIPQTVKDCAKSALELSKKLGRGGSSTGINTAHYLIENEVATPEKIRNIVKYFSKHKNDNLELTDTSISWSMWGGTDAWKWAEDITNKLDNQAIENKSIISNSEKAQILTDKRVKKEEMEMNMEDKEKEVVENAIEEIKPQEKANPSEEKLSPEDLKKIREEKKEKKFEFPKKFNLETMEKMFSEEEDDEDDVKMAKEELGKKEFANPEVVMSGMYSKMCKMAETIAKMAEDKKVYMAEAEELKKFKADIEKQQKDFEVEKTLKELAKKVVIPDEARKEMADEAEKFSLAEINKWKTYCKAVSFDFAVVTQTKDENEVIRAALPFTETAQKKSNDLWS